MTDATISRADRTAELIEVIVLAAVAILTAWSGYQGATWGGRQSQLYAEASSERLQSEAAATRAGQELVADATIFTAWLQAHDDGDRELMAQLEARFTPEYGSAFRDWLATDPFTNSNAPPGPGLMPGFSTEGLDLAAEMSRRATEKLEAGTEARETANQYIRATVLFASVLFLVAIAQRFTVRRIRLSAGGLAIALLCYSIAIVATLPRT
jgi:hypothetical protein